MPRVCCYYQGNRMRIEVRSGLYLVNLFWKKADIFKFPYDVDGKELLVEVTKRVIENFGSEGLIAKLKENEFGIFGMLELPKPKSINRFYLTLLNLQKEFNYAS